MKNWQKDGKIQRTVACRSLPPLRKFQNRVANFSVGASTMRGQPEGTIATARKYLQLSIDLRDFSDVVSEDQFRNILDGHTEKMRKRFESKSWGMARKVLNIFLFQAAEHIVLNRNYTLDKIIKYLELPLDNKNAKKVKEFARGKGKNLPWKNIKSLDPETSKLFQEYARQQAYKECNCERCYLEVYWWRSNEKDPNCKVN
jgi:hypothetical protein